MLHGGAMLARPLLITLALAQILTLAACRAETAPADATPTDHAAPAIRPSPTAASGKVKLTAAPAASAPIWKAVAARPELPEPRVAHPAAGARLVGRENGKDLLAFPLTHTRVAARVVGNVARVEVTQRFANPSEARLEAVYAFPLPANAAVTDMLFRVGSRVVLSEVHRRDEARATYEAARRAGRTAALTEQERPNLFTQSVANVPPGEAVDVVIRYVHEVPLEDGRYQFVLPTTIGPRYVPGAPAGHDGPGFSPDTDEVPDGSRVTPPVVPPGARSTHEIAVLVSIFPGEAAADVGARSHRIVTGLDGSGARLVALAEDDRVPDKDLVLSWRPASPLPEAHALVERERGEDFLALVAEPPASPANALVRPRELVFLLDKSGSMSGRPIEIAKEVILRSLRTLREDDTFRLVAFDGSAEAMADTALPGTPDNVTRAERWLAGLQGGGGTEMLSGIRAVLTAPSDPARLRLVVFCTDGFIGNEAAVIETVERLRREARVFAFGIGSSVNRYLVEGVARAGRGYAEVVGPRDPLEEAVARLFARLDRPVLTDLEVAFEGGEVRDLAPARLPDLFAGQPLVAVGRLAGPAPHHVVLRGRTGAGPWERRIAIARGAGSGDANPVAGTLWARRRVDDLLSRSPAAPSRTEVDEVVALALRFKLLTPFTSFVAVERELLADPGLELARVVVPNALPEGVSHESIFGPGEAKVLPARVKPGDPELWVAAPHGARSVRVKLPFDHIWRDAAREGNVHVVRFLVPPGVPDGSYDAQIAIALEDGRMERRSATIRVDTTPAAVAVVDAPTSVEPGETLSLGFKPALPLGRVPGLAFRPGGLGPALKGAMELREILVRAPWGEIARARMEGPLGVWHAELHVPSDAARGMASIEVVASDAAGNVSRRAVEVGVGVPPVTAAVGGTAGLAGGAALLALSLAAMTVLLRPRRKGPRIALPGAARGI
jgi:Ca-activated chloride channel family protein